LLKTYIEYLLSLVNTYFQPFVNPEFGLYGQGFDCVVKYLEHWKDHVDHRMLPIHDINRIIERELERQIAHDHHHHSLDL
jgi:hypothetical protein